jgi:L-ascorbate metabolism protein UlaG (beta-lactamase superfamily)
MKITKLGHCCLVIDIRGVRFLTDPGSYTTAQNEVRNIHYIVVSHEHSDHLHVESLKMVLKNNPEARVISNGSVGKILKNECIEFLKVAHGEKIEVGGVVVAGHGLKHANIFRDYEQVENTGYIFDGKLFYPGDAFYKPDVPVDILAFPVSGPWCNIQDAMDYALSIKPRIAFGVHDGNLKNPGGIVQRLPNQFFPLIGIKFVVLELGKETEL